MKDSERDGGGRARGGGRERRENGPERQRDRERYLCADYMTLLKLFPVVFVFKGDCFLC